MANQTLGLKNVNMLTKAQYNGIANVSKEELYAVEVETYSDDDGNWYRIYPDGWCEQGGTRVAKATWETITFLKPFKDTKYISLVDNSAGGTNANGIRNKTTTTMQVYQNCQYDWYVCGYVA